jgi:DNA invertase Pin-like site-specific DNA recombinase
MSTDRPGLEEALRFARTDDTLIVWQLDRLGRSLKQTVHRLGQLVAACRVANATDTQA